jgi:hypothetical protein
VWADFRREHGLPYECSAGEYGLEDEWNYFAGKNGVWAHERARDDAKASLRRIHDYIDPDRPLWISSDDVMGLWRDLFDAVIEGRPHPEFLRPDLDALWFNKYVSMTSDAEVRELRRIPYKDYLCLPSERGWRVVRR